MNIPRDMNEFRFGFFQYEVAIITALDYLKMGCANEAQKRLIEVSSWSTRASTRRLIRSATA